MSINFLRRFIMKTFVCLLFVFGVASNAAYAVWSNELSKVASGRAKIHLYELWNCRTYVNIYLLNQFSKHSGGRGLLRGEGLPHATLVKELERNLFSNLDFDDNDDIFESADDHVNMHGLANTWGEFLAKRTDVSELEKIYSTMDSDSAKSLALSFIIAADFPYITTSANSEGETLYHLGHPNTVEMKEPYSP